MDDVPERQCRNVLGSVLNDERLLTAAEVAERLGYTKRYVGKLGREGVLPRVKMPGRKSVRFAPEDVDRFVREGRRLATRPVPGVLRAVPPLPRRF